MVLVEIRLESCRSGKLGDSFALDMLILVKGVPKLLQWVQRVPVPGKSFQSKATLFTKWQGHCLHL